MSNNVRVYPDRKRGLRVFALLCAIALATVFIAVLTNTSNNEGGAVSKSGSNPPLPGLVEIEVQGKIAQTSESRADIGRDDYVVEFPDGECLPFHLRAAPASPTPPTGRMLDVYEKLRDEANAAAVLSHLLQACGGAHRTVEELEYAIDQIQQTHTVPLPGSEAPATIVGTDDMSVVEQIYRNAYVRCNGVSEKQIEEADDWLKLAAELGDTRAMMTVGQTLLGRRDPRAQLYLESAWSAGDVDAASLLWYFHSRASPEQANLTIGYAYKYLHDQIINGSIAAGATLRGRPISPEASRNAALQLSPTELNEALLLAKDILRQNHNCCFSNRVKK